MKPERKQTLHEAATDFHEAVLRLGRALVAVLRIDRLAGWLSRKLS